jgi:hypothetical protein
MTKDVDFTKPPTPKQKQRTASTKHSAKKKLKSTKSSEDKKALQKVVDTLEDKPGVIEEGMLENESLTPTMTEEVRKKILWQPLVNLDTGRSPQREFLEATEDVVLLSGTRGSAKSDALLVDPLRYCENRYFRGLIVRRTMPELAELINRARILYPDVFPGVRWKQQEKVFVFPSGARMEFGYCEKRDDVERYRGQEYAWLGIDELTMFPDEDMFDSLMSSVRVTREGLPAHVRCTTNPFGAGVRWVKKRFIDRGPENTRIVDRIDTEIGVIERTYKWIHSTWKDNPLIRNEYVAFLATISDPHKRKAFYEGSWDGGAGVGFPDFDRNIHVIKPFDIPSHWPRFRACDYGYTTMAACLWLAIDPEDRLYVYRELTTSLVNAPDFADMVLDLERGENIKYGVIDGSLGANRGSSEPTLDEQMAKRGCRWRYADRSKGSRVANKNLIHQLLGKDKNLATPEFPDGQPRLVIFNTCLELIDELSSLPPCSKNPEDVDTDAVDHAYDALRYAISSRPRWQQGFTTEYQGPTILNSAFGY